MKDKPIFERIDLVLGAGFIGLILYAIWYYLALYTDIIGNPCQ